MATSSVTKVVTAHLPGDLADKLDSFAETRERSRGWVMKQALRSYIEWEEEKDRLTIEALEESDRVGTISHEEVVAWAKSLSTDNPLPAPKARKS